MILLPRGVIIIPTLLPHRKFSAEYPAASHLGAPDEVMEAFPSFGVGTKISHAIDQSPLLGVKRTCLAMSAFDRVCRALCVFVCRSTSSADRACARHNREGRWPDVDRTVTPLTASAWLLAELTHLDRTALHVCFRGE